MDLDYRIAQLEFRIEQARLENALLSMRTNQVDLYTQQMMYNAAHSSARTMLLAGMTNAFCPMPRIATFKPDPDIFEIARALWPHDAIRDWSDRSIERIKKKYAWIDKFNW